MDAADWDRRYVGSELVWGAPADTLVIEHAAALPAGHALDLACGEGHNALWLATRAWRVDAVDFSQVAIDKGRTIATRAPRAVRDRIDWLRWDVTELDTAGVHSPFDLVLMVFLHLPSAQRRAVLRQASKRLAPGGTLLVVGHDSTNFAEGFGGPSDPDVLFSPTDIVYDLAGALEIQLAERRLRPTESTEAIDAVVVATAPEPQ